MSANMYCLVGYPERSSFALFAVWFQTLMTTHPAARLELSLAITTVKAMSRSSGANKLSVV